MIEGDRLDPDADLARSRPGLGQLDHLQDLGSSVLGDDDGAHGRGSCRVRGAARA
jgi:hypothetical protein